jgi:hypothetical protein
MGLPFSTEETGLFQEDFFHARPRKSSLLARKMLVLAIAEMSERKNAPLP